MTPKNCHILIVGAGITGLTTARELLKRGVKDILIVEKERGTGCHSSGRNSGVLHAGMYYTPETLKAKYCVRGNRLMKEFCRAKGLTLQETGKVILAGDSTEVESLYELKRRADLCGARAYLIGRKELHELEPGAAPGDQALFSPDTAVIKPTEVLAALEAELEASGKVNISFGTVFHRLDGDNRAVTSAGPVRFEKLVNAAGSYADRVAGK
ncbi:MAG: FAD-dependent oxidoreductase, partial [Dehalococcoidales bacterium]